MKFSEKLFFSLRILLSKKGRIFLTSFSIGIGVAILLLFRNFTAGLEHTVLQPILDQSSPTTLIVRPNFKSVGFFTGESKIEAGNVEKIKMIPGVESVGKQMLLGFPNSIRIRLFGFEFNTDAPIFGVDHSIVELPEDEFQITPEGKLPVVISPRLMDLFNSSLADALAGIPRLTEADIVGRELTLIFGESSFFRVNLFDRDSIENKAVVITTSPKVPAIGVSIPLQKALELNEILGGVPEDEVVYHQLFLEAETIEDVPHIQQTVREMGFLVENFEELGSEIRSFATIIRIILFCSASAILLVAFFSLFSLTSVFIIEQKKNIGILQALGAKKNTITYIFLIISAIISGSGLLIGIILCLGLSAILDPLILNRLPELSFLPDSLFPVSFFFIALLTGIIFLLTSLFTFFPIRSATRIEPIKAIWG